MADAHYTVTDLDAPKTKTEIPGRELIGKGLRIEIKNQPGAAVITYKMAN